MITVLLNIMNFIRQPSPQKNAGSLSFYNIGLFIWLSFCWLAGVVFAKWCRFIDRPRAFRLLSVSVQIPPFKFRQVLLNCKRRTSKKYDITCGFVNNIIYFIIFEIQVDPAIGKKKLMTTEISPYRNGFSTYSRSGRLILWFANTKCVRLRTVHKVLYELFRIIRL